MFSLTDLLKPESEAFLDYLQTNDSRVIEDLQARLTAQLVDIVSAAADKIMTIKLLDLALSAFLPSAETVTEELAVLRAKKQLQSGFSGDAEIAKNEALLEQIAKFREVNPALGLRGVRLSIVRPDLFNMQIAAILNAIQGARGRGMNPQVKILIPAVSHAGEIAALDSPLHELAMDLREDPRIGACIETARGCVMAGSISPKVKVICIDTDQLHATTFGYSPYLNEQSFPVNYVNAGFFSEAPYAKVDQAGVGKLMQICVDEAKKANPEILVWASGANCATRKSVDFCYTLGVHSVTCRPERLPVARLCAAQAILGSK
jgi:pyruvate,orthophosphate dikinase